MMLRVDPASRIPPFEQLRGQLALLVAAGQLRPGARLPAIRDLARELDLAPGTVARAYRELEIAGIVEGRGRRGTFVTDEPPNAFTVLERQRRLEEAAEAFAATARQLDIDRVAALRAASEALERTHDDDG
ncbi:MAG: GntR family transcriptional regulator [Acidimicrobiales bacterium]|nr:GntR family transcriptional regulator [Acidimicrobiales bacterium]